MKKVILVIAILFTTVLFSQITDLVTELNTPLDLVKKDNTIYFTSFDDKKVYELDLMNNSYTSLYTFSEKPNNLFIEDNELYVGCEGKTYLIDLSQNPITPTLLTYNSGSMYKIGNELYIGLITESKIIKYNLSSGLTTEVINDYKPVGFTFLNDELYFATTTNKLHKLNINTQNIETVLTTLDSPRSITFNGNYFFISEYFEDKISIYNLPDFSLVGSYSLEDGSYPWGLFHDTTSLFFIQSGTGKLSKIDTSMLTVENIETKNQVELYPNPSTSYIQIFNLKDESKYLITNSFGEIVIEGSIKNNQVNTEKLKKGVYFLITNKGKKYKFIKK
ncbi:MAG: T9SS type A sorting domain-containing protein [Flavobacteriales bacterium]|nr:T9SS type A sorting domain-containing protein [Flavobacteriales bacterium]